MIGVKKKYIVSAVISGAIFSISMALFDYYNDVPFSYWKFMFYFFMMALFNGVPQYWAYRNKEKNDSKSFNDES